MTLGVYSILLRLLLPMALLRLYARSLKAPAYRRRIGERLASGDAAPRADLWIHAVSVGEVQAAELLIRRLRGRDPALRVLVTTTTPTGAARVQDLLGDAVAHRYTPYDLPGVMRRFLHQVRPRLVVVVETEIWPSMLAACERQGIPVVLANARLSARSARGYARVGGLTRETLQRFARIAAQSDADAQRLIALGADAGRVQVTGSIKFDLRQPASQRELAETLRRSWGIQRPVWVAASTHEGEDAQLLEAHRRLLARLPKALLVLVPRHPERFDRVAALVERQGLAMARRSREEPCREDRAVLLGDTMGELAAFLAAGDAAFIGGSLVPTGGHNLLEAATAGVPVAVGPHTFNFAEITEMMVREGAAVRVADAAGLAALMQAWLSDAALRAQVGEQGRAVVERNRGALDRLVAVIDADAEGDLFD
ncbi:lipid IV(A) 3-deoxy-D-manno-octulosonic acid transferase [Thiorhodococcus minor]|uniref:3-deoxy-D-manno-octulosonic acid transferase n=1 Tax=Thiorhodococcus minor TaxID=57489 RepID=A0A6M0JT13_9GAMM|nr:lipid IV(A) 3-deoxy-D-manno-octulosonic acid transferase [Thiorhodococcus minor]NEV60628.1 3-deoxy-D-manno-octulosonic acid transferase [Thiorhodococcus minor]